MDINEILAKLPPDPAGVESWIRKELVNKTYLIYNKKENKVVCTRCGHTYRADRFYIERGDTGECPRCHSKGEYKPSGVGRGNLAEFKRILLLTHRGNTVYGTFHEIVVDFSPFGVPNLSRWLSAVYVFNEHEQRYYKHHPGQVYGWAYGSEYWEERKNIKIPGAPHTYGMSVWETTEIYEDNLEKVFTKSCLKYAYAPDLFTRRNFNADDYIRYIQLSLKYQSLELLRKAGFETAAMQYVTGCSGSRTINWRGKDLRKILGLPRRWIRFLQDHDPALEEIAAFKSLTEAEKKKVTWEEVEAISNLAFGYVQDIKRYTSALKFVQYKNSQNGKYNFAHDWLDYIKSCRKLGMDIERKDVLFPKDFKRAHDEATSAVKIQTDKERELAFRKIVPDISILINGLSITTAKSQKELNEESRVLNHCVRTYGEKILRGESLIFFIRNNNDLGTPYYTLETDWKGKFIQCRGKNNCSMTEEVKEVVEQFKKDIPKILKKAKERSAA